MCGGNLHTHTLALDPEPFLATNNGHSMSSEKGACRGLRLAGESCMEEVGWEKELRK